MVSDISDIELAYRVGELFNKKITAAFWDSFKGSYGHTQVEALVYLHDHESATASELTMAVGVPKQHISKIIKGFVEEGIIISKPHPNDKRASIIMLSESGTEFLQEHYNASYRYFESLMNKLPPEQQQDFRNAMQQMQDILLVL